MKKNILLLLVAFAFLLIPIGAHAKAQSIQILIDGEVVSSDASPIISSGRVLVPVRVISESLGYFVKWDPISREVQIKNRYETIKMVINKKTIWKSDDVIPLDVAPMIQTNRTYLPIRAISESLGAEVAWDSTTKAVIIKTIKEEVPEKSGDITTEDGQDSGKVVDKGDTVESGQNKHVVKISSLEQNGTSIRLRTSEKIDGAPEMFLLNDPNRLVVDIKGTVIDEELEVIKQQNSDWIKEVRYSQFEVEPNIVRVVIDLTQKVKYSYRMDNDSIVIDLVPYVHKVVIDAGHGGTDPGASAADGTFEKNLNLSLALKVTDILKEKSNIELIMPRNSDTYPTLTERIQLANYSNADLFVSIHANALPSKPEISGTETYYYKNDSTSLAKTIHEKLVEATGFDDRGIRQAGFKVIKYTEMPAVLLEVGYLTNRNDVQAMKQDYFQQGVAEAIADGIIEYLQN